MRKIDKIDFEFKIESLKEFLRILIPEANIEEIFCKTIREDNEIELEVSNNNQKFRFICKNYSDVLDDQKLVMLKVALLNLYNKNYNWGGLIGVRPSKLIRRFIGFGYSYDDIEDILINMYGVSREKTDLIINIVKSEMRYLNRDHINLYIGIPYCPTKCKYCSFASYTKNGKIGKNYDNFIDTLIKEIELTGEFLKDKKTKIESIYFGGGTPAILEEDDLVKVLEKLKKAIDFNDVKEFTFEAGRTDVITEKKLDIMKKYGIDRISINPQTFNETTLKKVNRSFNLEHFNMIYQYAKELGFIINMDFIIGLPEETDEDILNSLDKLNDYDIENLTIHVLAIKKSATLNKEGYNHDELHMGVIKNKIKEIIDKKGLKPYYMYRQKNSFDDGENIGYAKDGYESRFNIEMIEENQSTFAIGGGAITKYIEIVEGNFTKIDRVIGPKDPIVYTDSMEQRFLEKIKKFKID